MIAGVAHAEAHAQPPELLAAAAPALERWQAEKETQVVDRWREELGRNGRASIGVGGDARSGVGCTRRASSLP